jgi:hypothetical protein
VALVLTLRAAASSSHRHTPGKEVPVSATNPPHRKGGQRDLYVLTHPDRWTLWPFLPLVRRHPHDTFDCGVLYDFANTSGRLGYSATVFLTNVLLLPGTEEEFLKLPKEVFDTPEEVLAAGWTVD